jgi:hypothetical protein
MLLFVGIRNAWDTVIYVALQRHDASKSSPPSRPGRGKS